MLLVHPVFLYRRERTGLFPGGRSFGFFRRVLPGERHGFSDGFLIRRGKMYPCASGFAPCSAFWRKHFRVVAYELLLLIGCEFDHSRAIVGVQGCKDPPVRPEVGVSHVCAFDGAGHPQRDPSEIVGSHKPYFKELTSNLDPAILLVG